MVGSVFNKISALIVLAAVAFTPALGWADKSNGNNRPLGFVQLMNGPSTAPFSDAEDRGDAKYQDCPFRINGVLVGRNTAEYTDEDGTPNRSFAPPNYVGGVNVGGWSHVEFVHDAGARGKMTLRLLLRGPGTAVRPAALGNAVILDETGLDGVDLSAALPGIEAAGLEDGVDYLSGDYILNTVTADVRADSEYLAEFEGSGIYKNVEGVIVRCVFIHKAVRDPMTGEYVRQPNGSLALGDMVRCVNCVFFWQKS